MMRETEGRLAAVEEQIDVFTEVPGVLSPAAHRLENETEQRLADLPRLTQGNPEGARQALDALLEGRASPSWTSSEAAWCSSVLRRA
ncbi:MAG TPA: hypothetical protein VLS89_15580 [Candidatus Nanopelagicales bacterium]|nr:hypothetical protein [Candidatus Nanopelagicales bacterium]